MANPLWLDELYLVLFVLTGLAAVVGLLTLAFGMLFLPQRVTMMLVVFYFALTIGGVIAILTLVLPWASSSGEWWPLP